MTCISRIAAGGFTSFSAARSNRGVGRIIRRCGWRMAHWDHRQGQRLLAICGDLCLFIQHRCQVHTAEERDPLPLGLHQTPLAISISLFKVQQCREKYLLINATLTKLNADRMDRVRGSRRWSWTRQQRRKRHRADLSYIHLMPTGFLKSQALK